MPRGVLYDVKERVLLFLFSATLFGYSNQPIHKKSDNVVERNVTNKDTIIPPSVLIIGIDTCQEIIGF
mgnify:CR=1 FL=1